MQATGACVAGLSCAPTRSLARLAANVTRTELSSFFKTGSSQSFSAQVSSSLVAKKNSTVTDPQRSRSFTSVRMSAGKDTPFLTDAAQLISSVETFVFDCDGVIWKGDTLIDGIPETLDMLRALGKKLIFVTNNSTKSRKQYGKKFESLGLNVTEEEIFSSSFAAAGYLKSIEFPVDKKVYIIGEIGIQKELEQAGIQYLGGPEDGDKRIDLAPGAYMDHDHDVGAVVVGFDRYLNYYKLQLSVDRGHTIPVESFLGVFQRGCVYIYSRMVEFNLAVSSASDMGVNHYAMQLEGDFPVKAERYATLCIRENPGCLFIATNCDAVTHLTDAQEWAGGGSMVGAIKGSTKKEPTVVGKPSTFMLDYLANKFKINKTQICMVGDRLDTDILFGQNGGCKTLLVLSGVTDLTTLQSPENSVQPDSYTNQLSDLLAAKKVATV